MLQHAPRHVRVLAVDDSPSFLLNLRSFFENNLNFEVMATAGSGKEALLIAEQLRPDLILMDLEMPGMNGLEATTEIRKRFPSIPVVMLTAHQMPGLRQRCQQKGVCDVVAKSRLALDLPATLAKLLPQS
jgi:CheY-like chemotaxis protein